MRVPASRPGGSLEHQQQVVQVSAAVPIYKGTRKSRMVSDRAPKPFRNLAEARRGRAVLRAGRLPHRPCAGGGPRHHHARPFRSCAARPRRRAGHARDHRRHEGAARRGLRRQLPGAALWRDRLAMGGVTVRAGAGRPYPRQRAGGDRARRAAARSSPATTSAAPTRPRRRSSWCAATCSSPRRPSACRCSATSPTRARSAGCWHRCTPSPTART